MCSSPRNEIKQQFIEEVSLTRQVQRRWGFTATSGQAWKTSDSVASHQFMSKGGWSFLMYTLRLPSTGTWCTPHDCHQLGPGVHLTIAINSDLMYTSRLPSTGTWCTPYDCHQLGSDVHLTTAINWGLMYTSRLPSARTWCTPHDCRQLGPTQITVTISLRFKT